MSDGGEVRIARSVDQIDRAKTELTSWHRRRTDSDSNRQYQTPLNIVRDEVASSLTRLRSEYDRLDELDAGGTYDECRRLDLVMVFIGQLWDWYREKFDQRDTDAKDVLHAADEIVHSCYATAFPHRDRRPSSEPLTFLDARLSPVAGRWHVVPEGLDAPAPSDANARVLGERIEILGIPTIRLPSLSRFEPWLLVLVAHEVGHHVHQGLGEDIWNGFGRDLSELVDDGADPSTGRRWRSWGREIFADVFGVLACGPALIWAIGELEGGSAESMAAGSTGYPPAPVRWLLMAEVLGALNFGTLPDEVAATVDRARSQIRDDPRLQSDVARARPVVQALLAPPPGILRPPFVALAGYARADHARPGAVATWRARLSGTGDPVCSANRPDARLCAAAATLEWPIRSRDAREGREAFAARVLLQLARCHEEGTRAAGPEPAARVRSTFADDLLARPITDLLAAAEPRSPG